MIHLVLAFLKFIRDAFHKLIVKIQNKIKKMETQVTSDLASLTKFVNLKSLAIDAAGNVEAEVEYYYKDAAGRVLKFADEVNGATKISIAPPDPSLDASTLTPEQLDAQTKSNAVMAALLPVLKNVVPDVM